MTTPNDTAKCYICGKEFPFTSEFFEKAKRNKSGLSTRCLACNRERCRQYGQTEKAKQKCRERKQREYAQNPQKFIKRVRVYQVDNPRPDKARMYTRNYRARRFNAPGSFTQEDVQLQYQSQKGLCWWCGKPLNRVYQADHLIALTRGGTNWPNNIVCACPSCNRSKGKKLPHEWNGRLF